jgi:hypothetical protein
LTEEDYAQMLDALDRLLNDPDVPMPAGVDLAAVADVSQQD